MKIYANETGEFVRILKTYAEETQYGVPDDYTSMIEVDAETNQHIVNHIGTDWNNTKLLDGVLYYKGSPVMVNPPGAAWLAAIKMQESEGKAAAIPNWSTWTEQEALDWYAANVTDLIEAIPDVGGLSPTAYANNAQAIAAQTQEIINAQALIIRNMARMLLALRNKVFPNLEGG